MIKHMDMTEGVIWRQLVAFATPIIIGSSFQLMYNAVDSAVVGKFISSSALAAVGGSNPVSNLLVNFFTGIGSGAGVLISQHFGRKDTESLRRTIHSAIGVTLVLGVILTIIGVVASPYILRAMQTPEEVLADAILYLRIFFGGVLASLMYNMASGILRALGDSTRPLYYLIYSSILHIALNFLFVVGFRWGIASVAWSTVISQFLAAILCLGALMRERAEYRLDIRNICFQPSIAWEILRIGLPTGTQNAIVSFSNLIIQSFINGFGADAMAGTITYFRLDAFAVMPLGSLGLAITTFVGQNVGARKFDRVRRGTTIAVRLSIGYVAVASPVMYLIANPMARLFSDNPAVIGYAVAMLQFLAPFWVMQSFMGIYAGAERGAGQTLFPMVSSIASMFVLRVLILTVLLRIVGDIRAIYMTYAATWTLNAIFMTLHFKKSNWLLRVINM